MESPAREVAGHVATALAGFGLRLIDMKLKFGRLDEELSVIDALSGDTCAFMTSPKKVLSQLELARKLRLVS